VDKHTVAKVLQEIGLFLELRGENPFKSRAYYNAARTVEQLEGDLEQLVREGKLREVRGIGSALNKKISELVHHGSLKYYEELKASIPSGLLELLRIPGLGPRKIKVLYDNLGIATIGELEYACKENRLVKLKGFGAKTQENILKGIEFSRRFQGKYFFSEARKIAQSLLDKLGDFAEIKELSLAGSLRRCREVVKDIDLVAAADRPEALIRYFSELPQVFRVMALGETKISVQLQEGINADLRAVQAAQFPYTLHHFTGSKEHNTALRHRAKSMGMKINEYGIFRGEELVICKNEEEIFQTLGLSFIPPELREDFGEIEAAAEGTIPLLVEERDIQGVFHVHTAYSDGVNSLEELIQACREMGYTYIGFSDHSQSAYYAGGLKVDDIKKQQEEINALKEKYPDFGIFSGIESDIRSDGSLDYPDEVLECFDFVIASIHSGFKMTAEKMTSRIVKAVSHPRVTMLGHPTGRILPGREGYPFDLEEILLACLKNKVIVELNASPARLDLDWRSLKKAKELGVLVSINPDAHRIEELNDTAYGVAVARKGWLEKKDIFNTRSRDEVQKFLQQKVSPH